MNEQIVIDRIRSRLEELGESSFDVSVRIGKHRNFLNDLIVGRKKRVMFQIGLLGDQK